MYLDIKTIYLFI